MDLRMLTLKQVQDIFHEHLIKDFPAGEVKPLSRIEEMWFQGIYTAYGLFHETKLRGYAFFVKRQNANLLLLDYLAICRGQRSGGYGAEFLQLLSEELTQWKGIILEVENPVFEPEGDAKELMERRIGFYERNGFDMTQVTSCLFQVEYKIMARVFDKNIKIDYFDELDLIYHAMFPGEMYLKNVMIRPFH